METHDSITDKLRAWTRGEPGAADEVFPLIYGELRRRASTYLANERSGHTLQPTALVHETYMRLNSLRRLTWRDRGHFFAMAAKTMRRILVDHAKGRKRAKRGGSVQHVPFAEELELRFDAPRTTLALDEALNRLAEQDPFKASILELRIFGGLSISETAEALGCSTASIQRHARLAKAWLLHFLVGPVAR